MRDIINLVNQHIFKYIKTNQSNNQNEANKQLRCKTPSE